MYRSVLAEILELDLTMKMARSRQGFVEILQCSTEILGRQISVPGALGHFFVRPISGKRYQSELFGRFHPATSVHHWHATRTYPLPGSHLEALPRNRPKANGFVLRYPPHSAIKS